ncbi:MAG: PQQ-binding-like beta-propeller repeat protein [Schlesneria sp.]
MTKASLILRRLDGTTEPRELSRSQPLTIGRQSFNDICISEPDVAPMHCRVSWNKTGFEVTAATPAGVEVNSGSVAHMMLNSGDTIRVGSVDLIFEEEQSSGRDAPHEQQSSRKSGGKAETVEKANKDLPLYDGKVLTESQAELEALQAADEDFFADAAPLPGKAPKQKPVDTGLIGRPVRPGEQEILKSPLVLGLTGGGLVLLLVTGIFWFLISRETSNRLYDRAVAEMNDGQLTQSITTFERFIAQYPNHGLRRQADRGLAKAHIQKEISGASPTWKRGLEKLNELIKAHRNESDFSSLHPTLFQYAEQISMGAAKSAETNRDADLLVVSKDAQDLLERYSDPSAPPAGTIGRINEQRRKATNAIEKQKTFDVAMKTVDTAIADKKPMAALSERERLVKSFPEFITSKRVKEALQKSLDLERSVVATDETERPAEVNDEAPQTSEPILGIMYSRSRTEDNSQGQVVFVTAKDSCYAVDPATGELVWKRVIGVRPPFFPVKTTGSQPSVLMFDTRDNSLVACQLSKGRLIWRQRLNARAIGKPLVHEGQIYLPLEGNSLVRIDLDTGRQSAIVKFSQNLATSPVLSRDGNYLLVPGEMAMIYSLTLRTTATTPALSAVATTFTDHAAGSISASPLVMGDLLLLCENDLADSARLRLWNAKKPAESLIELPSTRIVGIGQVHDTPVLRGNQLVVPSSGEQFAAFVVTDEAGHEGIAPNGQYKANQSTKLDKIPGPLFVAVGPDNQFWSAGSAFRRFEINSNTIRMDSVSTAPGIASQPLQLVGEQFCVGRKSIYSDAVTFSAIEREKLTSPWRIIVGDAPLEMISSRDGGVIWIGESGTVYTLGKNRIIQGGFDLKAGTDLELPTNVTSRIRATLLPDQRLVVVAAGETITAFMLNQTGQLVDKYKLNEAPQADPVLLDEGLVFPLPSRLKMVTLAAGRKAVQDMMLPVGEKQEHRWSHLIRIDGKELIACDGNGRLSRIQFRSGDVPHLAEVAELQLGQPVDVKPFLLGEFLFVADASGVIRQLNVRSFDTDGQTNLTAPIKNIWPLGANLLVQAGDRKLHCLSEGKTLMEQWSYDLLNLDPVGPAILKDDQVWLACQNGTVIVLNRESGAEARRITLPQTLSIGLRQIQETLFAVASDGTLYRLD